MTHDEAKLYVSVTKKIIVFGFSFTLMFTLLLKTCHGYIDGTNEAEPEQEAALFSTVIFSS